MKYKLVCIDIDGTLLNGNHKVSETSKEALKKAHDMGVHLVISTGRMYTDAEGYSDLIGLKSPIIASNGALIREKGSGKVIYKNILEEDVSLKLLDIFAKHGVRPSFYTPEKAYIGSMLYRLALEYIKLRGRMQRNVKIEYVHFFSRWKEIFKKEKDNIVKCEVVDKNPDKLRKVRNELEGVKEIEVASSSKYNIEISRKGVSKGKAVEFLAGRFNVKREEIIALGDSENDLSMIEYAGMGIAMGNAIDIVKEKADYITDSNNKDGIAKAINRFIINEDRF